jgi:hypothetical protein
MSESSCFHAEPADEYLRVPGVVHIVWVTCQYFQRIQDYGLKTNALGPIQGMADIPIISARRAARGNAASQAKAAAEPPSV